MTTILIVLVCIAIALFVISFFAKDRMKDVEEQLEQLTIQTSQDTYQLRRKVEVFEEEMLLTDTQTQQIDDHMASEQELLTEKALHLHAQGLDPSSIAHALHISTDHVEQLLYAEKSRGVLL
ncbi:hypothetical protein [Aureibacillus halotolerans]|uniref:DUF2802 domain-containing protein n=1 Tax=Aureibacillus halotolerans TaxID=1508390 RepID=A0A4R6UA16_9BACI|nr:hypothetical protein [Aureibacillus halotolerans]TDQ41699.1 hypothetical protein EV213_103282 [Aureibacillus halotolerans]